MHYEIYTWTLCHSYLHEKQTSRIQSLNEWECGINKSSENRFAVHMICLSRAIHSPMNQEKKETPSLNTLTKLELHNYSPVDILLYKPSILSFILLFFFASLNFSFGLRTMVSGILKNFLTGLILNITAWHKLMLLFVHQYTSMACNDKHQHGYKIDVQ